MIKIAFIFKQAPHGTSVSREGLDALLAATAFCDEDEISVFFIDDGIFNLIKNQQPEIILQKDFSHSFKLLDLYEINKRYVCQESVDKLGLSESDMIISCEKIERALLINKIKLAEKVLIF